MELGPLPEPRGEAPRLFGEQPAGEPTPWAVGRDRMAASRNVWLSAVDLGRPHCRPVWAVWLVEGLAFSTGSPALQRGCDGGAVAATTETGDEPVILEGTGHRVADRDVLERFVAALNDKYDWSAHATDDGMTDDHGNTGPVFVLRPRVAFAWGRDMAGATRWRFAYVSGSRAPSGRTTPMSDARTTKQELIFKVVVNHEEQYSLWPADRENKRGWRDEGFRGTQDECTKYIRRVWKDMRPLSLRKELDGA